MILSHFVLHLKELCQFKQRSYNSSMGLEIDHVPPFVNTNLSTLRIKITVSGKVCALATQCSLVSVEERMFCSSWNYSSRE